MPASNSITEAMKRNRAMMHKPSLYENMKRYHKRNGSTLGNVQEMTIEERVIFEAKMKKAERKAVIKELKFYSVSIIIISVVMFFLFKSIGLF